MDKRLILEFSTRQAADLCAEVINQAAADAGVIDSVLTKTWDEVKQSPVGTFYLASPSTDSRFSCVMDAISDLSYTEKPFPQQWITEAA